MHTILLQAMMLFPLAVIVVFFVVYIFCASCIRIYNRLTLGRSKPVRYYWAFIVATLAVLFVVYLYTTESAIYLN